MMKRFLSALLSSVIVIALLASCTTDNTTVNSENSPIVSEIQTEEVKETAENAENTEDNSSHTIYFKDGLKSSKVTATFFNSISGQREDVEMKKISEDDDSFTFSCEGDTASYNMAYITYDDKQTIDFSFNKCVSGWYKTEDNFFPYTEGKEIGITPEFKDVTLTGYGYDKLVHIWTPDDYDASSDEKYSTIYMLDGQNIANFGQSDISPDIHQGVIEQVEAMNLLTGNKAIIVAIDNGGPRNYELVPNIEISSDEREKICMNGLDATEPVDEESDYDNMNSVQMAHFIAYKLVPYIQENYNVYNDALHTTITGSSLGGMESFYITMEYPEVFGVVGSLSPSFYQFDGTLWETYLSEKSFGAESPFIYFYTGPVGKDTDPDVTEMYNRLKDMGYPEDKLALHLNENGEHSALCWRSIFSEYLTAFVFQHIEPLQK